MNQSDQQETLRSMAVVAIVTWIWVVGIVIGMSFAIGVMLR